MTGRRGQRSFAAVAAAAMVGLAIAPVALAISLVAVAIDDSMTTRHDRTKTVAAPGVLGNDTNLDLLGGGLRAELVTDAASGDLDLHDDGGYVYTPDPGFVGSDSFRYKAVGALLDSNTATVTIDVTNVAPVAGDDSYAAVTGVTLNVPVPGVLGDDDDEDGDSLTAILVDGGGNGSLNLNSSGSFSFKSGGGFTGTRTFTYKASDGITSSNTATVTITVTAPTPTPTPTATPTPSPTPTPTPIVLLPTLPLPTLTPLPTLIPTPTPTPRVTPTPTPRATSTPGATATPSPEPSATPTASGRPGPGSSTSPGATPSPSNDATPTSTPGSATQAPGGGAGGTGGGDGATGLGAAPGDRFLLPALEPTGIDVIIDASFAGFSGIEWAVPAFVLGVPGLLLMIAVGAQAIVGIAWLPFVRRWLGGAGALGVRGRLRH